MGNLVRVADCSEYLKYPTICSLFAFGSYAHCGMPNTVSSVNVTEPIEPLMLT